MTIIIDGTGTITGATTLASTVASPTFTTPALGTPASGNLANCTGAITSGTAQASTSGTSIDFTGIPSGVKRVTVMFSGVSTNGTSNLLIQLGDAGGIENTGYVSAANYTTLTAGSTSGFILLWGINAAADTQQGCVIIPNLTGNVWVSNGNMADNAQRNSSSAGAKTLSAVLDRVRITTVNGTDTFDAGTINILYES